MFRRVSSLIALTFLALSLSIFFGGCKKKTQLQPGEAQSYADGGVYRGIDYNDKTYNFVGVAVFGPMIPWVTINNDTIPFDLYYGGTYWDTTMNLISGREYNLKVDFLDYGKITGSCSLPGVFTVNADPSVPIGSHFTCSWSKSESADWYWVEFYLHYEYNSGWFWMDTTWVQLDTTFTISGSRLFPNPVDSVEYSYGYVNIAAISGPIPQPGSYGNLTGNGYGFFLGGYFPKETDIWVQGSKLKVEQKEGTPAESFFKMLKKLIPGQGIYSESK